MLWKRDPHPEKCSPDALGAQTSSCVNHRPRFVRGRFLFANESGAEQELDAAHVHRMRVLMERSAAEHALQHAADTRVCIRCTWSIHGGHRRRSGRHFCLLNHFLCDHFLHFDRLDRFVS